MISAGEEVKDVPVGNLRIPIEGIFSADSDRQEEMHFWLGPHSVMLKEITCELRSPRYGLISQLEYRKRDKVLQDAKDDETGNSKVRLCGWNPVYEAQADLAKAAEPKPDEAQEGKSNGAENESSFKCQIQTFPATGSLLDNCARELFVALAASLTKIVKVAAPRIDAMENGGEVLLRSETVTILTTAFTENGLGTHADALLSIIPTLLSSIPTMPVHRGSPAEDKLLSTCIAKAEAHRRQKAWTRAEQLLRWMCERYSTPNSGKSTSLIVGSSVLLEKAVRAIGELYRWSFKEQEFAGNMKGNEFGMDGITWMAEKMESSEPTIQRILRNYEYVKTMIETEPALGDTAIAKKLLEALEEGKDREGTDSDTRCKTLYYLCLIKDCRSLPMQPALRLATRNGWAEVALSIIEMGGRVHDTDMDGLTPLHWAAANGDEAVARELLRNGANVQKESNRKHEKRRVPLHYAATNGHEGVVGLLLGNGANVNANDGQRKTALHLAAENGQEAVVGMLLAKGADIESLARHRETPLLLAVREGHRAIVRLLLENGAAVNEVDSLNHEAPLHLAATYKYESIARLLLEHGADINARGGRRGQTSLQMAAQRGHLAAVRLLLDNGSDVDAKDEEKQTSVHLAALRGHLAIVRLLLDNGAYVDVTDAQKQTPLHLAAQFGNPETVTLLLEKGAEVDARDVQKQTSLHIAAHYGYYPLIALLLKKGADVNARNALNETSLHLAASYGRMAIMTLLLAKGAGVDAKDGQNQTSLHLAARSGNLEIVTLLLDNGADVNARNALNETSLHLVASYGRLAITTLLIVTGADVNAEDKQKQTSLHLATRRGHPAIVRLLLEHSADTEAKDHLSRTPRQLAERERDKETTEKETYEEIIRLLDKVE
ncbi:hypothetical protein NQ176_g10027 [Zarea fungicola]|uniref:Uncharacterized protein n=1 Tax=Zarea fungicola TaxID=93591 RepID=A0ACC1MK44_9HYPO|nr:hypothetical protein NQ176_g10027 [Lecanicillium fungicola]